VIIEISSSWVTADSKRGEGELYVFGDRDAIRIESNKKSQSLVTLIWRVESLFYRCRKAEKNYLCNANKSAWKLKQANY